MVIFKSVLKCQHVEWRSFRKFCPKLVAMATSEFIPRLPFSGRLGFPVFFIPEFPEMKMHASRTKTGMSYGPIFRKLDAGSKLIHDITVVLAVVIWHGSYRSLGDDRWGASIMIYIVSWCLARRVTFADRQATDSTAVIHISCQPANMTWNRYPNCALVHTKKLL